MKKTHPQKILSALSNLNKKTLFPIFNRKTASRRYRTKDGMYLHNSVMRTARRLASNGGVLKRVSPGQFTLSKKGLKLV